MVLAAFLSRSPSQAIDCKPNSDVLIFMFLISVLIAFLCHRFQAPLFSYSCFIIRFFLGLLSLSLTVLAFILFVYSEVFKT